MPTYDYRCDACQHEFERFQSIKAAPVRSCPGCGKRRVRRLIGRGGAVLFKGGGFYETDYRSESYKKAAEKDKPSESKTDANPDKKPDSKPKTDAKVKEKPLKSQPAKDPKK
jgi:putative FmdB family regulatory protein